MSKQFLFIFIALLNAVNLNAQTDWILSNNGIPASFNVSSFTAHNNEIFALGSYNDNSSYSVKLYKSTNNGSNWSEVSTTGLSNIPLGKSITSLNGDLYISVAISISDQEYSVYKSQDNGQTWTVSNNGLPLGFEVNSFTTQNNIVYAYGTYYDGSYFVNSLYKTTDNGSNWTHFGSSPGYWVANSITSLNGYLYATGQYSDLEPYTRIRKAQDNGNAPNWSNSFNGLPSSIAIQCLTTQNNTIYAIGSFYYYGFQYSQLWKSSDNGNNWTEVTTTGLSSLDGKAILYHDNTFLVAYGSTILSSANVLSNTDFNETIINLKYYPNPVKNFFALKSSFQIKSVSIYNIKGAKVYDKKFTEKEVKIQTNVLPQGIYLVNVISGNAKETFKIIKK